jgi:glutamine amidotransferase
MTRADKRENIVMIASEPLTFERSDWMEVKTNTMLVVTPKMNILQIPIVDEYWVAQGDKDAHKRSTDYAVEMGFGMFTVPLLSPSCAMERAGVLP